MGTGDRVDPADHDLSAVSVPALCVGAALLFTVMFVLPRILQRWSQVPQLSAAPFVVAVFAYVLVGAAATQVFGLHPALGAVLAGLFFPAGLANEASQRAIATVADMLIPAFFVSSALSVPLQVLADLFRWSGLAVPADPDRRRFRFKDRGRSGGRQDATLATYHLS